jgi:hypothetical protein
MSERRRLPNRRAFFDFESMAMPFTTSVSRDSSSGKILELFCDDHKASSAVGTLVRDSAIIPSFALQHGADDEAIRNALCRDNDGRPLGPIGAALDAIATERTP